MERQGQRGEDERSGDELRRRPPDQPHRQNEEDDRRGTEGEHHEPEAVGVAVICRPGSEEGRERARRILGEEVAVWHLAVERAPRVREIQLEVALERAREQARSRRERTGDQHR